MSQGLVVAVLDVELYVEYEILKVVDYISIAASLNASLSVGYTCRCQVLKVEGGREKLVATQPERPGKHAPGH